MFSLCLFVLSCGDQRSRICFFAVLRCTLLTFNRANFSFAARGIAQHGGIFIGVKSVQMLARLAAIMPSFRPGVMRLSLPPSKSPSTTPTPGVTFTRNKTSSPTSCSLSLNRLRQAWVLISTRATSDSLAGKRHFTGAIMISYSLLNANGTPRGFSIVASPLVVRLGQWLKTDGCASGSHNREAAFRLAIRFGHVVME